MKIHLVNWEKVNSDKNLAGVEIIYLIEQGGMLEAVLEDLYSLFTAIPSSHSVTDIYTQADRIIWEPNNSGNFSMKSAYQLAWKVKLEDTQVSPCLEGTIQWSWKLKVPRKVKFFLWLAMLERIPFKRLLFARNITQNDVCDLGPNLTNTLNRSYVSALYKPILVSDWNPSIRNKRVIEPNKPAQNPTQLCIRLAAEFYALGSHHGPPKPNWVVSLVGWKAPALQWCKLNSDGSAIGKPGRAGGCEHPLKMQGLTIVIGKVILVWTGWPRVVLRTFVRAI
ncbi:hypothetical protein ACH5RR_007120 [Cinchona calisaya]|uniref:Reverse transcriptase zinc-binding domain-containing protein n=1 Tax=Cinchona calisaya TaxID=153742 RepID=A0ABD3ARD7_9GENT